MDIIFFLIMRKNHCKVEFFCEWNEPLSTFVIMVAKELYNKGQASNDEMFGWHSFEDVWVAFVLGRCLGGICYGDVWVAFVWRCLGGILEMFGWHSGNMDIARKKGGQGEFEVCRVWKYSHSQKSMLDSSNTWLDSLHEDHHTFGKKHVVLGCIAFHCIAPWWLLALSFNNSRSNKTMHLLCTFCAFGRVLKSSQVQKTYVLLKDKPHFSNTQTYMCNTQVAMGPWMKTTTPPPSSFCSATTTTTNAHGQLLHTSLLWTFSPFLLCVAVCPRSVGVCWPSSLPRQASKAYYYYVQIHSRV